METTKEGTEEVEQGKEKEGKRVRTVVGMRVQTLYSIFLYVLSVNLPLIGFHTVSCSVFLPSFPGEEEKERGRGARKGKGRKDRMNSCFGQQLCKLSGFHDGRPPPPRNWLDCAATGYPIVLIYNPARVG